MASKFVLCAALTAGECRLAAVPRATTRMKGRPGGGRIWRLR